MIEDENDIDSRPSKSERKRQSDQLQTLGEALIELPQSELDALPLPDNLRDAVELARRITAHGGLYRQKQYIGKLMRKIDAAPIQQALDAKHQRHRAEVLRFKRLEAWRERLLNETDALASFIQEHPHADRDTIETLVAAAKREQHQAKPPGAARELLRVLRSVVDSHTGK